MRLRTNSCAEPFLFLNYLDAHTPYFPPPEDDERFVPSPPGAEWRAFPLDRYNARTWKEGTFTSEEEAFLVGQYDAELVALDREFGRLLQYIRDSGLMENTLILVTTDHGESLFDRGFLGHGGTLYGVEINGFLVAKTPASLGDVRPSPLIQFVDFFPTIADAIGVPAPSHIQGTPWGHGRDYAVSELFCRDCAYGTIERHKAFRRELVAVSIDNHKLIRSTLDPDEVYDLGVAGEELTLSAAPNPEFLQRAEEILGRRKADLVEVTGGPPADEETLQKMRSLGYVK